MNRLVIQISLIKRLQLLSLLLTSFLCWSANADLTDIAKKKIATNQSYLCIEIDSRLCNINSSFLQFNSYFEELKRQRKAGQIRTFLDDLILENKPNLSAALSELKVVTYGKGVNKFTLSETLLTLIKFSALESEYEKFGRVTLNKIDDSLLLKNSVESWDIWQRQVDIFNDQAAKFDEEYKDPFYSASYQFAELGEHFIASAFQVKSTVPLAWKVSEATFLRAVKYTKAVISIKKTIEQLQHVGSFVKLVPLALDFMEATNESHMSQESRERAMLLFETELAILKQSNASKFAHIINDVQKIINYSKMIDSLNVIESYYPQDNYLKYPIQNSLSFLESQLLVAMADLLQSIANVSGITGTSVANDLADISFEAIKVFGDKTNIYRTSMARASLGEEYLHLRMEQMDIARSLYLNFSYSHFGLVVNSGEEIEKSRVNYYTPYLQYLSKSGIVESDVNIQLMTYREFLFPYIRAFYPYKGRFIETMSAACNFMQREEIPDFEICVEDEEVFQANWEKTIPKREIIKLLSFQVDANFIGYTDVQHYLKLRKYKVLSRSLDVSNLDDFVLDANAMVWLARTIFVKNNSYPIWWTEK